MGDDCNFCQIAPGRNPHKIVYIDDYILGFENKAQHFGTRQLLWSPLEHMTQEAFLQNDDYVSVVMRQLIEFARGQAQDYRLVMNVGEAAGQVEQHAHIHQIFTDAPLSIAPYCYHPDPAAHYTTDGRGEDES